MLRTPARLNGTLGAMRESVAQLQRWIPVMQQVHEAIYYVGRAMTLGHPEQFGSLEGHLEFLVYFRGALGAYAKCFTATGSGRMSLDGNSVYRSRSDLKEAHERVLKLRNTYTAHTDENEFETLQLSSSETDDEIVVHLNYEFTFPFDRLYELRDLITYLEQDTVTRHIRHLERISAEVGKTVRVAQGDER